MCFFFSKRPFSKMCVLKKNKHLSLCKEPLISLIRSLSIVCVGGHEPERGSQSSAARKGPEHQARDGRPVHLCHGQIRKWRVSEPPRFVEADEPAERPPRLERHHATSLQNEFSPDPLLHGLLCHLLSLPPLAPSTLHAWLPHFWLHFFFFFVEFNSCIFFFQSRQQSVVKGRHIEIVAPHSFTKLTHSLTHSLIHSWNSRWMMWCFVHPCACVWLRACVHGGVSVCPVVAVLCLIVCPGTTVWTVHY